MSDYDEAIKYLLFQESISQFQESNEGRLSRYLKGFPKDESEGPNGDFTDTEGKYRRLKFSESCALLCILAEVPREEIENMTNEERLTWIYLFNN